MDKEILKKIGTLGGPIHVRKDLKNMYFGENTPGGSFSKEKLFGCSGPLHPGMKEEHKVALEALHSDTRSTLIKELTDQTHLTRDEATRLVEDLLKRGILEEIKDPTLGRVLVFKEVR